MGGPSDRTEQRKAYYEYRSAVETIKAAMAKLRELAVDIEPGPHNQPPHGWTPEQRKAMQETVIAWYRLVQARKGYEGTWYVSSPLHDWK